ncbi:DNA-damage-inducible protein J [Peptoniphilus asaccharolyticus DSM 20463]|uniref:DNA-damage-inducible protein J n=1 Tax=Peptoniphilus asaccharolyticus DSM 20463 TaxID=573058 RepID=A0A1W1V132_PEPAS|nr:type II toxin-antitoxin system RelB/DinJ family antitoxin [Peptoniphilus asaccharolyticus]SMB87065.1 DNA-damage-inducible protein J [Peptoniphilus asaccharolyticus DSM 20463]
MSKVNLTISVDDKDKDVFSDLVSELGMNVSVAINMFIKQSIRHNALPLSLSIENSSIEDRIMNKYDEAFKELAK